MKHLRDDCRLVRNAVFVLGIAHIDSNKFYPLQISGGADTVNCVSFKKHRDGTVSVRFRFWDVLPVSKINITVKPEIVYG